MSAAAVVVEEEDGQQLELEEEEEEEEEVVSLENHTVVDNNNSGGGGGGKAARLPRWTKQEILVLIQGKRVAENRVRRGRLSSSSSSVEPKWATVSSYCRRHGVNRGAVQCRKRWSNLAGDFKKIKEWESQIKYESDSFWYMRNDIRRDRKLPGFFEREVYDILDDKKEPPPLLLFDSCRTAPPDDALFSEVPAAIPIPAPTPISAAKQQYQPFSPNATPTPTVAVAGGGDEKQAEIMGSTSRKRKRLVSSVEDGEDDDDETLQDELIKVMEKNGRMLSSQLEAHNINMKLDRQDRKDHATSLVAVLNKLADALSVIADKL